MTMVKATGRDVNFFVPGVGRTIINFSGYG